MVVISTPDLTLDFSNVMLSVGNGDSTTFVESVLSITVDQDTDENVIKVSSTWNFVPNGVGGGDKFRLLFVTLDRDGKYVVDGNISAGNADLFRAGTIGVSQSCPGL